MYMAIFTIKFANYKGIDPPVTPGTLNVAFLFAFCKIKHTNLIHDVFKSHQVSVSELRFFNLT